MCMNLFLSGADGLHRFHCVYVRVAHVSALLVIIIYTPWVDCHRQSTGTRYAYIKWEKERHDTKCKSTMSGGATNMGECV